MQQSGLGQNPQTPKQPPTALPGVHGKQANSKADTVRNPQTSKQPPDSTTWSARKPVCAKNLFSGHTCERSMFEGVLGLQTHCKYLQAQHGQTMINATGQPKTTVTLHAPANTTWPNHAERHPLCSMQNTGGHAQRGGPRDRCKVRTQERNMDRP